MVKEDKGVVEMLNYLFVVGFIDFVLFCFLLMKMWFSKPRYFFVRWNIEFGNERAIARC